MMVTTSAPRRGRLTRLLGLGTALFALVLGAAVAVLGVAAPADAANGNGCYHYKFLSSNLDLGVQTDRATSAGAKVEQLYASSSLGNVLEWCPFYATANTGVLVNQNSNLCLNTDGIAGHWLTQETCDNRWGETWQFTHGSYNGFDVYQITNVWYGLNVDVFHDSHNDGDVIDAWTPNASALNQWMYRFDI